MPTMPPPTTTTSNLFTPGPFAAMAGGQPPPCPRAPCVSACSGRACGVESILRDGKAVGKQRLHRVRRPVEHERQLLPLRRGEVAQHVGGRIHPPGRPPDPDPDPVVLPRSQVS